MITKTRARDEVIEKRLKEIDTFLEKNALQGKLNRMLYGHHKWRWYDGEKTWEKNPIRNKSVAKILDDIVEGNL